MTALFSKILDMSLTASVVILAVLLVRLCLKKSPKMISYVLWAVVLFRLLCPVAISAPVSLLHVSQPQVTASGERTSQLSYLPAPSGQSQVHQPVDIPAQTPASQPMTPVSPTPQSAPAAREESSRKSEISLLNVAAGAWLAGVVIMVLHSAISYTRLRRRLVGATPFREEVYLADHITSPFVLGILQPRIYLPSDTPSRERQYILAHERHHIHRGDHVIKLLAYAALCLHWFNPLVWVAFFQAGKDMEMSCDEAVIRGLSPDTRADYAQTLLRLATHQRIIAGTPLAFGEGETKGRVLNIAKWRKPKRWVVLLSVALCAVVLVACGVNPQADAAKDTVDETKAEETITDKGTEPVSDGTMKMGLSLPLDVVDVEYGPQETRFFLTEPIPGQISSQVIPEPFLGGIRVYDAPEKSWQETDMETWLRDLGVSQIVSGGYDWMASSSEKAEMEVSFADAGGFETKHHYFTQGDQVFELWLDTETLNAMTQVAILQSVYFAEDASITRDLPMLNPDPVIAPFVEGAQEDEEASRLAQCRTFLEELNASESYSVRIDRSSFEGPLGNQTSEEYFYIIGEDWLQTIRIPMDGYLDGVPVWEGRLGRMYRGGQYYDNMTDSSLDENREMHWGKTDTVYENTLWFHRFQWDAQKVKYVSTMPAGNGQCITLQVMAPYHDTEEGYYDYYDYYFVQFVFDRDMTFQRAEITAYYRDGNGEDRSTIETLRVFSRSKSEAEQAFQYELRNLQE